MFKTQDSNALALRSPDSETLIPLYSSITNADITPGNLEMMEQNGCMTSFPGLPGRAIAAKPPVPPSSESCPEGMFAATVPPRKEYDHQSPSYAFVETAGPNKNGTTNTGRKIIAHMRCNYFRVWNEPQSPQRTWLVIHGWNDSTQSVSSDTVKLAEAVSKKYPNDRVLSLDWSEASNNTGKVDNFRGVYYAATWIRPVAEATVQQLRNHYGIDNLSAIRDLNIVGHSLGSLMSAEIGSVYGSGVNSITALDPASESSSLGDFYSQLGGYNVDGRTPAYRQVSSLQRILSLGTSGLIPGRDLIRDNIDRPKCFGNLDHPIAKESNCDSKRRVANFSRAFVGKSSVAGNQGFAASADESFQIDFGLRIGDPAKDHGDVVKVFTKMIEESSFQGFFGLDDLKKHSKLRRGDKGVRESLGHMGIIRVDRNLAIKKLDFINVKGGDPLSSSVTPDGKISSLFGIETIDQFLRD